MKEYIKECISSFGKNFNGGAKAPVKPDLFKVDESLIRLNENQAKEIHHIVANFSFVSKRNRPDINFSISFLCSRVDRSTREDWTKLVRLLHYISTELSNYHVP